MNNIRIDGRRWRDRINGNTYHAARVYVDGELAVTCPFQYGYGEHYHWTGWFALVEKLGLDAKRADNGNMESAWRWCERHGVKLEYEATDLPRQRDVKAFGAV